MSTSIKASAEVGSVRRRTCKRVRCASRATEETTLRNDSESSGNCCDESCLVEVARRECAKEGSHDRLTVPGGKYPERRHDKISSSECTKPLDSIIFPCDDHYKRTRDSYGALLDNLGCICKVLLSLNIESCCVLPYHSLAESRSLAKVTSDLSISASCNSATGMQEAAEHPKGSCCGTRESSESSGKVVPDIVLRMARDHSKKRSLTNTSSTTFPDVISETISTKTDSSKAVGNCRSTSTEISETGFKEPSKNYMKHRSRRTLGSHSSRNILEILQGNSQSGQGVSENSLAIANTSTNLTLGMSPLSTRDCSKESCCSHDSYHSGTQDSLEGSHSKEGENSGKRCCGRPSGNFTADPISPKLHPHEESCSKSSCCSHPEDTEIEVIGVEPQKCRGRHGRSEGFAQCGREMSTSAKVDECCSGSCSTSISTTTQIVDECSTKVCCTNHVVACDSDADAHSVSPASRSLQLTDFSSKLPFTSDSSKVDIERNLFGTERITLQVQGMTCTGCEKKLHKLLTSLPEVSQVKTSLLLAQAEFDLRPSDSLDAGNIAGTLQKLSGFTCTKMVHIGEKLELTVEGNIQDYADHWPSSVIDLTIINKNRIRVSYHPKAIGARELLADPFFQHTKVAPPSAPPLIASGRAHLWKSFYMTLFSAVCTIPVLVLAWAQLPRHNILYGAISLGLATLVQVIVAGPFYTSAVKTLIFSRMIEMDLLIVLSTTTAYIYSIVAYAYLTTGKPLVTGEFFETSTLLVTLIMVGRTVSSLARQRAVESITIESLQTNNAIIVDPKNSEETEIDARLLQYHDVFKVLPDMSIVTDGVVVTGESEVDESLITGEATLVHKRHGNSVIAGSVNHSGTLKVQVTRLPCENTIRTIGAMVDEAKSSKPKVQELADRIASYFVPAILAVTVVVFVAWVAVGKTVRHDSTTTSCIAAMTYAISVLIISCPCAIGLAVPMVVVIAGGVGARHGLIFKTAETIDTARKVSHVTFDKTGTLTLGKLHVVEEEFIKSQSSFVPAVILGLTTNSKHPVAKAVSSHLHSLGIEPQIIDHTVSVPGKGIEATWKCWTVKAGNPYWLNVQDIPEVQKILAAGLSLFCVTVDEKLVAVYGLQDSLRPDAVSTIDELQKRNICISIVSGDTEESVHSLASQLGIPSSNVLARCTPEQKQAYVKSKLASSPKSIVLFCGDGTNDAPSLAQASIGVHMNEGTEVAASAADAVIMRPSLQGILTLMDLSEAFHRRVVFNFAWSFIYNLFAILLAAGAFPHARISPQYAGLGELISVVPVIAIAMGLKWKRF